MPPTEPICGVTGSGWWAWCNVCEWTSHTYNEEGTARAALNDHKYSDGHQRLMNGQATPPVEDDGSPSEGSDV